MDRGSQTWGRLLILCRCNPGMDLQDPIYTLIIYVQLFAGIMGIVAVKVFLIVNSLLTRGVAMKDL